MKIYKTKWFNRFARRAGIEDASLIEAVNQAELGLVDADLGSGLIKQRVARPGQGKSGGFRTIIAYVIREKAFFLYGFAKNELDNIDPDELEALKDLAEDYFAASEDKINKEIDEKKLVELKNGKK